MISRSLFWGALMLVLGAVFTFGLATAMQQHATLDTSSYQPGQPSVAGASGQRNANEWQF